MHLILVGSAEFVENAKTEVSLPMFVDAYGIPYVPNFPGKGCRIRGEIFHVDEKTLEVLDQLEGHPERYTRTEVTVRNSLGEAKIVWIYLLNNLTEEKLDDFALVDDYPLQFHLANYVLPSERNDGGFVKQEWGGYE